ncbi:MAG: DUF4013 domain-containing protein [Anaerolineales bacterium]
MFFGFNLKEIFYFPFKDEEARKYLLIGTLVALAGFIIPILPYFVMTGYAVQIVRQIFRNESPRMVAWDNWNDLFKDGIKVFGVRLISVLPILVLVMPIMIMSVLLPIFTGNSSNPGSDPLFAIFIGVFGLSMCIIIPFSIAVALIIPAAEMHVADTDDFSSAFRFREWWAVFRANLSGFLAAFAIYYLAGMAVGILVQILMVTVVLACLLPIVLPAITFYIYLIMYTTIAQAYRDGKAKLAQAEAVAPAA